MTFRSRVGLGYGEFWRGLIWDREYKNLDSLVKVSKRWFRQFNDGARFLGSGKDYKWVWPTGEELLFRAFRTEDDYFGIHGQEFSFIGVNELTKQPSPELYDSILSTNRSSFLPLEHSPDKDKPLPEIPLMVFATTNPYGVGHNWVKQRFIDAAPPGVIVPISYDVFNPRTQQRETVTKTQVRLFSSYKENRFLSPEYVVELESIVDQNKRRAWLYGDWDITSGGMFDDVWSSEHNIVEPFNLPHTWPIRRAFDWGSSAPFSVLWYAESDGSDVRMADGQWRSTIPGDIYIVGEWYGWNGTPNKGLRMLDVQIAAGIVEREIKLGIRSRVKPGPADNSINDDVNGVCIATNMSKPVKVNGKVHKGVQFTRSDKSAGTRKLGAELIRTAIYNAQPPEHGGPREYPGIFVFRTCKDGVIRTIPTLPRSTKNLDDVDCWTAGTLVSTSKGMKPIEQIIEGDLVNTPIGKQVVTRSYISGNSDVIRVKLSNGKTLKGTSKHPVMVAGIGLVFLADLKPGDVLETEESIQCLSKSNTKESHIDCIRGVCTSLRTWATALTDTTPCIDRYTKTITAKYRKVSTFITRTVTGETMRSAILLQSARLSMQSIITENGMILISQPPHGEILKKAKPSLEAMRKKCVRTRHCGNHRAQIVASILHHNIKQKNIATIAGKFVRTVATELSLALFAEKTSSTKRTAKNKSRVAVLSVDGCSEKEPVYNVTVNNAGLYYANGVLSSNTDAEDHCYDAFRYIILSTGNRFSSGSTTGHQ